LQGFFPVHNQFFVAKGARHAVPSGHDFIFAIYQTECGWLIFGCPFGTETFTASVRRGVPLPPFPGRQGRDFGKQLPAKKHKSAKRKNLCERREIRVKGGSPDYLQNFAGMINWPVD
jgi:hypothetical protein